MLPSLRIEILNTSVETHGMRLLRTCSMNNNEKKVQYLRRMACVSTINLCYIEKISFVNPYMSIIMLHVLATVLRRF